MYDGSLYMLLVLGAAIASGIVVGSGWHHMRVSMCSIRLRPLVCSYHDGFWLAAVGVVLIGCVAGWWLTRHGWLGWYPH